jgi:hypothetical protein
MVAVNDFSTLYSAFKIFCLNSSVSNGSGSYPAFGNFLWFKIDSGSFITSLVFSIAF